MNLIHPRRIPIHATQQLAVGHSDHDSRVAVLASKRESAGRIRNFEAYDGFSGSHTAL